MGQTQKLGILWAKDRDANSRLFHTVALGEMSTKPYKRVGT